MYVFIRISKEKTMKLFVKLLKANILLFLLFLLSSFQISFAQTCKSSAPSQVAVGQNFNYNIVLNEKATKILSVNFDNFTVLGGPNQSFSSSTSWINGQATQNTTYTYSYVLQPKKAGTFTIPAATVSVGGKQVKSNAVTITVVNTQNQQSSRQSSSQTKQTAQTFDENDVYVKAYASKSAPYQGEEVIITHKLYVGQSVNGGYQVTGVNVPSQSGFWSYTLGDPDGTAPATTEVINGKRFSVHEIRRTAVFPQKSGKLTISPFELDFVGRVFYRVQSNNPWDDFFGGGQRAQDINLKIKSNSVQLNVKELPQNGRPDDFSGVVGNITMKANLSRNQLKTNDATNLTITLSGTGNLQYIDNLNLNFPPDLDVSDPKITDNINTKGNSVNGSRSVEYVIIPRMSGEFTIPPITFSYFDLQTKSYKILESPSFTLNVEKGEGDAGITTIGSSKSDIKILGEDIRFIKNTVNGFSKKNEDFFATPWYFFYLLLPLFLFLILIILRRKKIEDNRDIAKLKNKRANRVARKRLKRAHKLLQENKKEEFYIEISQVLWGYISDKFQIPLSELSMESVNTKLKEKNLNEEAIKEFLTTLDTCEFARFSPEDSSQLMNDMYTQTLQFISKIEKNI